MTPSTRPTTRLTSAWVRDRGMRPVVVTVTGSVLELRLKGTRSTEVVDVSSLYLRAVRERVARDRAAKLSNKRGKRTRRQP